MERGHRRPRRRRSEDTVRRCLVCLMQDDPDSAACVFKRLKTRSQTEKEEETSGGPKEGGRKEEGRKEGGREETLLRIGRSCRRRRLPHPPCWTAGPGAEEAAA